MIQYDTKKYNINNTTVLITITYLYFTQITIFLSNKEKYIVNNQINNYNNFIICIDNRKNKFQLTIQLLPSVTYVYINRYSD